MNKSESNFADYFSGEERFYSIISVLLHRNLNKNVVEVKAIKSAEKCFKTLCLLGNRLHNVAWDRHSCSTPSDVSTLSGANY